MPCRCCFHNGNPVSCMNHKPRRLPIYHQIDGSIKVVKHVLRRGMRYRKIKCNAKKQTPLILTERFDMFWCSEARATVVNMRDVVRKLLNLSVLCLAGNHVVTQISEEGGQFTGDLVKCHLPEKHRTVYIGKGHAYAGYGKETKLHIKLHENSSFADVVNWRLNELFSSSPYDESNNLCSVNNDPTILRWNHMQLLKLKHAPMMVGLIEQNIHIYDAASNSVEYCSIIHCAPGICLRDRLVDAYQAGKFASKLDDSTEIIADFGEALAYFHIETCRTHLDLSVKNVFSDRKNGKNFFTLIDNHSIAISCQYEHSPVVMSLLFAMDREYFVETLKYFMEQHIHHGDIEWFDKLALAFRSAYQLTFDKLNSDIGNKYTFVTDVCSCF